MYSQWTMLGPPHSVTPLQCPQREQTWGGGYTETQREWQMTTKVRSQRTLGTAGNPGVRKLSFFFFFQVSEESWHC